MNSGSWISMKIMVSLYDLDTSQLRQILGKVVVRSPHQEITVSQKKMRAGRITKILLYNS